MTRLEDRQPVANDIKQACVDGARLASACAMAGKLLAERVAERHGAVPGLRRRYQPGDRRTATEKQTITMRKDRAAAIAPGRVTSPHRVSLGVTPETLSAPAMPSGRRRPLVP